MHEPISINTKSLYTFDCYLFFFFPSKKLKRLAIMVSNAQIKCNTYGDELIKILKPDLTGKVIIVTRPNSGIGLETARILAGTGAKIIIPCRTHLKRA